MPASVPFTLVLQQFSALRRQANDEWAAMQALTAGGSTLVSVDQLLSAGDLAERAPLNMALRRFVKNLPDNDLFALLAMIYSGRDGSDDPPAYWNNYLHATIRSRSAAVEVVLEKEPAADYIERSIDLLRPGLSPDSLPSLINKET